MARFIELRLASTDNLRNVRPSELGAIRINIDHLKFFTRDNETNVGSLLMLSGEDNMLHVLEAVSAVEEKIKQANKGR